MKKLIVSENKRTITTAGPMGQMNMRIPKDLHDFLQAEANRLKYKNTSDFVRELFYTYKEQIEKLDE